MGMHFNPHNPQQYQDDPSSAVPGNIYPSMLPNQQAVPHGTGNAPVNSNVPMNANHQTSSCGQPSQPHWTTTGQVANPGAQNPNVIANAYAPMNATQQPIPQTACNLQANPGLDQRSDYDKYGEPIDAPAPKHRSPEASKRLYPEAQMESECMKELKYCVLAIFIGIGVFFLLIVVLNALVMQPECDETRPCINNDEVCNYRFGTTGFCEPCPDDCLREAYIRPEGNYACCRTTTCPSHSTEMCVEMTLEDIIAHHGGIDAWPEARMLA